MWPTSRGYTNPSASAGQQQPNQSVSKSIANSVDTNQLLMAADSLRTLFGDKINPNLLNSIRENSTANRMDTSLSQMTSRRPQERHVIEYENPNYSRLDRSRLSQMSSDFGSNDQRFNDSPPLRTETIIYDPSKMPQKSILKKSKDQSFEASAYRTIEDEDLYLYGNPNIPSGASGGLPPGIVSLEQQNNRSPPNERSLSPISLRLKREMEKMDRSRRQLEPHNEESHWTPRIGINVSTSAEEPVNRNEWNDEEEVFKRRYRDLMNPSPDRSLEIEKLRLQQMAAIQAGILTSDKSMKRREMSPKSPLRHSNYTNYRRSSPELSPKRVRRRSPSRSPRRRNSRSPRRQSRSPRKRSISPRRRSISPRSRRGFRSRSRERYRRSRSRSRTPPRRRSPNNPSTPNTPDTQMILMNPMPAMMRMPAPGMPFMPPHHNLVGLPMGPMMGQYMGQSPQMAPTYHTFIQQNIRPNMPNVSPKQRSALKQVPIDRSPGASAKKPVEKKEDKLLNPHDLLVAERAKLRDELEAIKKQLDKKKEEQEVVVKKDGGKTDSYSYKQLDKTIKELRNSMEAKHDKLIKNFELINEVQKSKTKAKAIMEQWKTSGDISKVDLKKKGMNNQSKSSPKNNKSPDKKSVKEQPKQDKKEEIDEEEEDEKSSRFHYFDSGPHYCKDCNKFLETMKQYFSHIHSKDHLSKQKESIKTPWITKDYMKEMDKQVVRNKDQLVVASKGIQFILPTHGFFCELCEQFLHDSYQAEKHFKSAKHNRNYTRYTLLHNDYEHKWKAERDRAYTDMKRKERELEKERSKREAEKKIEDRKRLEEEVKRKDREVKEKIEAMNKTLKSVKELDDPKAGTEQKKDDRNKSSPKSSIRLNLSKNSNETNDKSKTDSSEKRSKSKEKSREKCEEKSNKLAKTGESMDTSEGIEDMLVIDEINCDSLEEDNENHESNDKIDENVLLLTENHENNPKTDPISGGIDENKAENSGKSVENIKEIVDTSGNKEIKQTTEENSNSVENKTEISGKTDGNSDHIEGVMPQINDSNLVMTDDLNVSEQTPEDKPESNDDSNLKNDSKDNSNDELVSKPEDSSCPEPTEPTQTNSREGCAQNRVMTYTEVVSQGPEEAQPENSGIISVKLEVIPTEDVDNSGSVVKEEPENESKPLLLDTSVVKTENMFDFDFDIEKFNERLKYFDSMVKKEVTEPEAEEEDPLDGFDVIDETNNEDNNRREDNNNDVIELSD